jgi:hypothetical protein
MTGIWELFLQGIGTAQWCLEVTTQTLAQLAAGLHELPSLQVQLPSRSQEAVPSRHRHCTMEAGCEKPDVGAVDWLPGCMSCRVYSC